MNVFDGKNSPEIPAPLFILGLPKTGTSFLRNILNGHPQVHIEMERLNRMNPHGSGADPAGIARGYSEALQDLLQKNSGKRYCGDKVLFANRTLDIWAPLFLSRETKVLVMVRDPRDRAISSRFHYVNREGGKWFYQPRLKFWEADAEWRERWLPQFSGAGAHVVTYEELYRYPEKVLRGIFLYLELPWDPKLAASMIRCAKQPALLDFSINPVRDGRPGEWKYRLTPDECLKAKAIFPALGENAGTDWEFEMLEMLRPQYYSRMLFLRFPALRSRVFWRWLRRNRERPWVAKWWNKLMDYEDPLMERDYYPLRALPLPADWVRIIILSKRRSQSKRLRAFLNVLTGFLFDWAFAITSKTSAKTGFRHAWDGLRPASFSCWMITASEFIIS